MWGEYSPGGKKYYSITSAPPQDPAIGLSPGPYGGPGGGLFLMSEVPLNAADLHITPR